MNDPLSPTETAPSVMIDVSNVTQHYGIRPVLSSVNLNVRRGELVALMAPNGAGKSTLLGTVAGVLCPQKGHIEIAGMRRRRAPDEEMDIRKKVFYLPDHPWLPMSRTGREFLLSVGRLYDVEDDRLMDHVNRLLQLFDLEERADAPIRTFSSGQQKKIAICSALVTEVPVMVLDEPFSGGLDPAALLALKTVLARLAEREDVTVLMATPVPELVDGLAHRVAILRDQQIVAFETPDGLRRLTGCPGSLTEVLERLINPQTLKNIDRYFEEFG